jgi:hypothetical protein
MQSQLPNGTIRKVNFVILESPHVRHQKQPILHRQYPPYSRLFLLLMGCNRGN